MYLRQSICPIYAEGLSCGRAISRADRSPKETYDKPIVVS